MTKTKNRWWAIQPGPERAFLLEAFTSDLARSLWVPFAFSMTIFSTGFLFPSTVYFGISVHVLDALVYPASTLIFLVAKFVKKVRNWGVFNFSVVVIAGTFAAIVPSAALTLLSGQYVAEFSDQVPVGIVAYSLLIGISGVVLAGWRISRERFRTLRQNKTLLKSTRSELENQITTIREEIRQSVVGELEKALKALENASDAGDLSSKLFSAIDEVIRPLSHRLAGLGLTVFPPKQSSHVVRTNQPRGRVSLARLAAPDVFLAFFAVLVLPATLITQGLSEFFVVLALALFETWILVLLQRRAQQFFIGRLVGLAILTLMSALIGFSYVFMVDVDYDGSISIGFVLITLTSSGIMVLVSKRLDDIHEMALVNQELQAVVSVLRQEAWVTKNQLAKAIHGSVQAKFLSVALRIANSQKISKADLAAARKVIESSLQDVSASLEGRTDSFSKQFKTIAEAWDGVAKLNLKADKQTISLINEYPVARTCVLEVIGEAVSNAAKHSKALAMDIELQENSLGQVVVSVWSGGKLAENGGRKGYGSQMLDEVTSSWSLSNLKGRVYLRAVIQLGK